MHVSSRYYESQWTIIGARDSFNPVVSTKLSAGLPAQLRDVSSRVQHMHGWHGKFCVCANVYNNVKQQIQWPGPGRFSLTEG